MARLKISLDGIPVLLLAENDPAPLRAHIENGYPEFLPALNAGRITGEVIDDGEVVSLADPPAEIFAERARIAAYREGQDLSVRKLFRLILALNNRVLALEGKAPVTAAQLRDWIAGQ